MTSPQAPGTPHAAAQAHVLNSALRKTFPMISHGEGVYLYDMQGKRYLDACGGAMVVTIGHGVKGVGEAVRKQIDRVAYIHRSAFSSAPLERLAELVAEMAPGDLDYLFATSGGSEATETAIKLAAKYHRDRGHPEKHRVIARWQSYHGNTLGALSASGFSLRRAQYTSLLLDFPHVAPMYCYRCPFGLSYPGCAVACATDLERVIRQEGAHTISAFIVEPLVAAAGGASRPPQEYFRTIREICDRHDVLMIADEVVTGFGRTGRNFAVEHWDVLPDLMVVGKGMGSGYAPLAGVVARRGIVETIRERSGLFSHGFTYGGNPVSAAAGVFVLEYLRERNLVQRSAEMGALLHRRLGELARHRTVGDVRGLGLLAGIELVRDRQTREPYPPERAYAQAVTEEAMARGLMIYPGSGTIDGVAGDHFLIAPPFIIDEPQVEEIVGRLDEALTAAEARFPG